MDEDRQKAAIAALVLLVENSEASVRQMEQINDNLARIADTLENMHRQALLRD